MNHRLLFVLLAALTVLLIPGCDAAVAIFEFGWWVGVIIAAIVIGLIAWMMSKRKH